MTKTTGVKSKIQPTDEAAVTDQSKIHAARVSEARVNELLKLHAVKERAREAYEQGDKDGLPVLKLARLGYESDEAQKAFDAAQAQYSASDIEKFNNLINGSELPPAIETDPAAETETPEAQFEREVADLLSLREEVRSLETQIKERQEAGADSFAVEELKVELYSAKTDFSDALEKSPQKVVAEMDKRWNKLHPKQTPEKITAANVAAPGDDDLSVVELSQKQEFERGGWKIYYTANDLWSAEKTFPGDQFAYSTANHETFPELAAGIDYFNRIKTECGQIMDGLPPIDFFKFIEANGNDGNYYDPFDVDNATPHETRLDWFEEVIGKAEFIRASEQSLADAKTSAKERAKIEKNLQSMLGVMSGFLNETNRFFGAESVRALREKLKDYDFYFSDDYLEIPKPADDAPPLINPAPAQVEIKPFDESSAETRIAIEIPLANILPSQFKEQLDRSARFSDEELDELAASLKVRLINPITVRRLASGAYEVVAGERRYRAMQRTGRQTIAAFIDDLTDEQAREMQLIENIQRKDPHPVDESNAYAYWTEEKGWTIDRLVARFGKSYDYIAARLKLRHLFPTGLLALQNEEITLSHAIELAKYPFEAQKEIFPLMFTNYEYSTRSLLSVPRFIKNLEEHYLHKLTQAPFPIKKKDLLPDRPACTECPETSGGGLFREYSDGEKCLNRACWNRKKDAFIQIQRREIAKDKFKLTDEKEIARKADSVMLVAAEYVYMDDKPKSAFLNRHDYTELKKKNECDYAQTGVFINGSRVAQKMYFCIDAKCLMHRGYSSSSSSSSALTKEQQTEKFRERREEIFNIKVAALTRQKVLKAAADKFTGFAATEPDLFRPMVQRLWSLQESRDSSVTEFLSPIVAGYARLEEKERGLAYEVDRLIANEPEKLDDDSFRKIAFLLMNARLSEIYYFPKRNYQSDRYRSQKDIKSLAAAFEIDYRLLDAETRFSLVDNKHKDKNLFREYADAARRGDPEAKMPRLFYAGWEPGD